MQKRLLIFSIISIFYSKSFSQNWAAGVDESGFTGGFVLQTISSEYKILKKQNWRTPFTDVLNGNQQVTPGLRAIYSVPSLGFGIGGLVNKRLSNNFDARISPIIIFNDRIVRYEYEESLQTFDNINTSNLIDKKVQATMFEIPLGIKIKSNRLNNFRAYWLGGAKYSMDIASKKKTFDEGQTPINKLLKNKRNYFSYETGIGFDLYFEYFKMSPEIKVSYSMNDVLQHDNTAFANPLDKTRLRHFTFSLFFE